MSLSSSVAKCLALTGAERRVFAASAVFLPACAAALRVAGFAKTRGWLMASSQNRRAALDAAPARIASLVNAASGNLPIPSSCLTRSLVLDWMLRRRGVESDLRIGVRLVDGRLEAHAWIEVDGQPLNDSPAVTAQFAPFEGRVTARLPMVS